MMGSSPGSRLCASLLVLRVLKHSKDRVLAQALLKDSLGQIIPPDFGTYDESSAAQTPFIFTERDRQLQKVAHMSSSNLPVPHISDKGNETNLLLCSVPLR